MIISVKKCGVWYIAKYHELDCSGIADSPEGAIKALELPMQSASRLVVKKLIDKTINELQDKNDKNS